MLIFDNTTFKFSNDYFFLENTVNQRNFTFKFSEDSFLGGRFSVSYGYFNTSVLTLVENLKTISSLKPLWKKLWFYELELNTLQPTRSLHW